MHLKLGLGFKPTKAHKNGSIRAKLHDLTMEALQATEDLKSIVQLPQGADLNEWYAVNTIDFFNDVSLLYGIVADDAVQKFKKNGEGFPTGYEYRWMDPPKIPTPIPCCAPQYCEYVMSWVEQQISDQAIFPTEDGVPFPHKFPKAVENIFKRLFRIFAIMYHGHLYLFEQLEMLSHLNTCFKRFVYFSFEFNLIPERELGALAPLIAKLQDEFYGPDMSIQPVLEEHHKSKAKTKPRSGSKS